MAGSLTSLTWLTLGAFAIGTEGFMIGRALTATALLGCERAWERKRPTHPNQNTPIVFPAWPLQNAIFTAIDKTRDCSWAPQQRYLRQNFAYQYCEGLSADYSSGIRKLLREALP
jgi:hypothetical protein